MPDKQYILALDQGTTSSRAILFDADSKAVAIAQREFQQIFPQPGWVEHDALEIWESQLATAREALKQAGIGADQVAAIGITNQRETTVVWDRRTGQPIHNAIVWQDRRTAAYCEELKAQGHADSIRNKTGLVLDAYFSGTKLRWILDEVPGARQLADEGHLLFGTIDTWLVWRLSGGALHISDESNASRTMMYDIREHRWDEELLELLNVPASVLPEVRPSSERYGNAKKEFFGAEIPIAGMAGDQQAALFGQMCIHPGMGKNTYGTGCFLVLNTGDKMVLSDNKLLSTVAWRLGDKTTYALEGSVFIAGAAVQWMRDGLGLLDDAAESEAMAKSVPDNGGVYFVPALTGLGAPHWDPFARGAIVGLTRGTTAAHIVRAGLEGIAYQVHDVIRAMESDTGVPIAELRVDGGAISNDWLMQFQADILGTSILRPEMGETTALGAAYLAGLAVGFWESTEALEKRWGVDKRFEATMPEDESAALISNWERALERAKGWIED